MPRLSLSAKRAIAGFLLLLGILCFINYIRHLGWFGSYEKAALIFVFVLMYMELLFIGPSISELVKHREERDERMFGPRKNVQVIDGADNCTYSIFAMTSKEFSQIFPSDGQDIEFIEDVVSRLGEDQVAALMKPIWTRMLTKSEVMGIHGTLLYGLSNKKKYYPTKKDDEMTVVL